MGSQRVRKRLTNGKQRVGLPRMWYLERVNIQGVGYIKLTITYSLDWQHQFLEKPLSNIKTSKLTKNNFN